MAQRLSLPCLSGALLFACATALHAADLTTLSSAVVRSDAGSPPTPPKGPAPERCPYATIHVDWPRADGESPEDSDAFAAIAASYLAALPEAGFTIVSERSEAYWHALLRLRRSRQSPQVYVAATTIFARGDADRESAFADKNGVFEGPDLLNAVQFRAPDQQGKQLEYGGIFEVVEFSHDRIGDWADRAATHAHTNLVPRIERLCSRRGEELEAEERRLEQIRQSLTDEIRRVRKLRAKQGKEIELRTDETEGAGPAPAPGP
jgi:hypothetical protein